MIKASMLEFARTGRLGPLASGVSRHEVHRLPGDPPLWGTQPTCMRRPSGTKTRKDSFGGVQVAGYERPSYYDALRFLKMPGLDDCYVFVEGRDRALVRSFLDGFLHESERAS